jgi:hypothetical protein
MSTSSGIIAESLVPSSGNLPHQLIRFAAGISFPVVRLSKRGKRAMADGIGAAGRRDSRRGIAAPTRCSDAGGAIKPRRANY